MVDPAVVAVNVRFPALFPSVPLKDHVGAPHWLAGGVPVASVYCAVNSPDCCPVAAINLTRTIVEETSVIEPDPPLGHAGETGSTGLPSNV
jgi:hypothetical protein